jgi:16S rRNA (guanine966-N2)-methyltransferase
MPAAAGGADRRRPSRGAGLRPTSAKVLAALMNTLAPRLPGARVLDLFAGTGRVGIEALRRGAEEAVFVERDPRLVDTIRAALGDAGVEERGSVRRGNAVTAVAALAAEGRRFDLVLLDPPYGGGLQRETLARIAAVPLLTADGLAIAEGHWRDDPGEIAGLTRVRVSRYGETALWVYAAAVKKEDAG